MGSYARRCGAFCTLIVVYLLSGVLPAGAQANEWTWMGGSQTGTWKYPNGLPGVYGTQGTPAAGNIPGARDGAATWTDSKGNLWLFGGEGTDANGSFGQLNDLWELNPATQQWAWMGGSSTLPAACAGSTIVACGPPGVYGTLGSATSANVPGGRSYASHWTDSDGNFWLFGGIGFDASQNLGDLNDLWELDSTTRQWTWMGGSSTVGSNGGQSGAYRTLGSAAAANIPGGRDSATNWVDKNGQFWLYGGEGFDGQGNFGVLDDMWKFDPTTNEWTWVSGSDSDQPAICAGSAMSGTCGWLAVYGSIGVPAPGISPGSRIGAAGWTDSSGDLWLFGGLGPVYNSEYNFGELDQYDLWEFDPSTQQWAWMSGNSSSTCSASLANSCAEVGGTYGTQGVPSLANIPPGRDNAVTWADAEGNFWLFGGEQPLNVGGQGIDCNDVWVFEPSTNEWAWMSPSYQWNGTSCFGPPPTFGTLGSPAAANPPSGRMGAASWTDSNGNLWIFGGYGASEIGFYELNELWVYQPASPAPQPSFELVGSPNPVNLIVSGTGAPAVPMGTTTISILVADGFDSPVTLTADNGMVDGNTAITGSLNPTTVIGAGSSTLTFSATQAEILNPQPTYLTITATSGGISQSTQVLVEPTAIGKLTAPTFSPPAGTYSTSQAIAISGSGGPVYYTTDGTTPTVSSPAYINPITLASTTTLKAIVIYVPGGGGNQSAVSSATYHINPLAPQTAAPVFSVPAGTYTAAQTVTISDTTNLASIYWTTDGSTPTTNSNPYGGPITVSSSETLKAIAWASGDTISAVTSAAYTINLPSPSFTLGASLSSLTVNSGGTGATTLTVTPENGFNSAVSFACTGLPAGARCSFSPSTVTPAGAAASTTLTIAAAARSAALRGGSGRYAPEIAIALLIGLYGGRKRRRLLAMSLLVTAGLGLSLVTACGGGGGTPSGGGGPTVSIVTVTATSGSLQQSVKLTLTVN